MGGARHGKGFGHDKKGLQRNSNESVKRSKYGRFWQFSKKGWYGNTLASFEYGRILWHASRFNAWFVSLLALILLVQPAYAATGIGLDFNRDQGIAWGPNVVSSPGGGHPTEYGVITIAYDKWYAALITLGVSQSDTRLDHTAMAKLSNASTGGAFYTFAQSVHAYYDSNTGAFDYPGWGSVPGYSPGNWGQFDMLGQVYGDSYVFWVQYTNAQYASAKEDLEAILNGGNLGGGGSSGGSGYTPPSETFELLEKGGWIKTSTEAENKHFYVNASNITGLHGSYLSDYSYGVYIMYGSSTSYSTVYCVLYLSDKPITYTHTFRPNGQQVNTYGNFRINFSSPGATKWCRATGGSFLWQNSNTVGTYTFNQSLQIDGVNTTAMNEELWVSGYAISASPSDPVVPPTNWPESDPVEAPQPPEVPEPQEPEIDPQPDPPTPQPSPTFPIYVDVSTTTYTADLQGILDAMNDHCIHLQNAIHTNISDFWTSLSTKMTNDFATLRQYLHGQFSWLGETVQDEFSETRDYLKELFEWLADQFDYSISGGAFNDSTVVSWLKKIYSKLGTGTSSKPVDPVADPDQTGSWLDTLINNLLTALEDVFPGLIGQVADFFGGALGNLTQKFPFSIPWDVAAILGMLVAEPVAPSVEIPAYTLTTEGLTQAGSYDIDLSAYDAAWGAVRIMMRIAFALYVCVHTKDFLEVIERVMM